ncbi:uncharacterized protein LOC144666255 [Oculina patagonica]
MAIYLKIVLLTSLLSPMVLMEEVNPGMPKQGEKLRQRTKNLEESVRKLTERMKEQDERMKEQDERMKEQEERMKEQDEMMKEQDETMKEQDERMKEQDERMKEQEERIKRTEETMKALEECKACSKIQELNETLSELQEKTNSEPADFTMNSAILADNALYQSRLHQFLTPAVGSNQQWVLCYRLYTHGWAARTFHSRCDGKRDTVTIIKSGQYVFGGYTDIPWDGSLGWGSTSNAFIFSLRNKEGLGPFKSMVTEPQYAIISNPSDLPTFGLDIHIASHEDSRTDSYTYFGYAYSLPSGVQNRFTILAGTKYFTPDEVEVFYLG